MNRFNFDRLSAFGILESESGMSYIGSSSLFSFSFLTVPLDKEQIDLKRLATAIKKERKFVMSITS